MLFSGTALRAPSKNLTSPTSPYLPIFGDFVSVHPCGNASNSRQRPGDVPGEVLSVANLALDYDDGGTLKTVVDLYVVVAICVLGFFGNAVTVLVLRKDPGRVNNTTNWLLQCLALVDTMFLLTCLLIQPLRAINDDTDWMPVSTPVHPRVTL